MSENNKALDVSGLVLYQCLSLFHVGKITAVQQVGERAVQLTVEGISDVVIFNGEAKIGDYYLAECEDKNAAVLEPDLFLRNFKQIDIGLIPSKDTRYQNIQQGIIVNAVQWDNHPSTLDLLGLGVQGTQNLELKSVTFFGKDRKKTAYMGDWIIKYPNGFVHILAKENFNQFYIKV